MPGRPGPAGAAGPPPYYPVFLDLRNRRCVVLGEGDAAEAKASGLREAGAEVLHVRRAYRDGDLEGAFLAIDASGDRGSHEAVRRAADDEGTLLNILDIAGSSDWIAPAVLRRGALQIAVSSAGESPLLAVDVRDRLAAEYGEEWGRFAALLGEVRRRLRENGVQPDAQRRVHRRLMASEVRPLLRAGRQAAALALAQEAERSACARSAPAPLGEVVLAGAGPGSATLLTIGAREALATADVVFHDALVQPEVLRLCGRHTRVVDVGRRAGCHAPSQDAINQLLIDSARTGNHVVRLKGGDPMLLGRGGEEISALLAAGIPLRVIAGVSAALAAPGTAGFPLTHRGVSASVSIVAGHTASGAGDRLEAIAAAAETLVVLMPHDLASLAVRLARVVGSRRPAVLLIGATTPQQRTVRGPLAEIPALAAGLAVRGPATLVVGDVVGLFGGTAPEELRAPVAASSAGRTDK